MSKRLHFPNADTIYRWGVALSDAGIDKYMPIVTKQWASHMESCMEISRLHPDKNDICASGARIFYKIIKNHYLVDGNKRSAVISVYLFFFLNDKNLDIPFETLYRMSKKIAQADDDVEKVTNSIKEIFIEFCQESKK